MVQNPVCFQKYVSGATGIGNLNFVRKLCVMVQNPVCFQKLFIKEGLLDVTCTYTHMIDARSLVSFLYSLVWRKTTEHAVILD